MSVDEIRMDGEKNECVGSGCMHKERMEWMGCVDGMDGRMYAPYLCESHRDELLRRWTLCLFHSRRSYSRSIHQQ